MVMKTVFTRAYLFLLIMFVCVMICFGVFIYHNTAQTVKLQLGNKCIGIASAIAVLVEDDIDDFIAFSKNPDSQSDYHQMIYSKLNRIRYENKGNIAFLYVETRISDTEIMYLLDAENVEDPFYSPPGHIDEITASEIEAYRLQQPYIPDKFVTNDYGTLLTCYVPLRNPANGEFLGLVGTDVSIDQYHAVLRNQLITIVLSSALLILLLFLSLLLSSSRVEKLIARDPLTGAYNKSYFMRTLRQQLRHSKHKSKSLVVFMADLDHFKEVNDTYGHVFGDSVLSAVAGAISKTMRKIDCFARYGGEEFIAFLPDTDITVAETVVERVRQAVENTSTFNEEYAEHVRVTVSIGVALFEPHHSVQDILMLADKALYQAKRTRNSISIYHRGTPQ